jgi:hypothetical protein
MTLSDDELDREWKPNARRPQSCVLPLSSGRKQRNARIANRDKN